jgi:hypothetical protein
MKKLRDWPAAIPAPSVELKKQYEYDPAAGAGNDRIISIAYAQRGYNSDGSNSVNSIYANGVPVSGTGKWKQFFAYHGFAFVTSDEIPTTSINYSDAGQWPAKSLKMLIVYASDNFVSKEIHECSQGRSIDARNVFSTLPGKVYEYKCSVSMSSQIINEMNHSPDGVHYRYILYYSDYLDISLMSRTDPSYNYTTYNVEFVGGDGKPHSITYRNDQLVLP